jgi:hypothetical protein
MKDSALVKKFKKVSQPLLDSLKKIEEELTQPKAVTDYDLFNFPNKLNDKLAGLRDVVASADAAPTTQSKAVFEDLSGRIDVQLKKLDAVKNAQLPEFNQLMEQEKIFMIGNEKK